MPSGPPELHEKWCAHGPYEFGDWNAQRFLQDRGWVLGRNWHWTPPTPGHEETPEESEAINYLVWEWDFGGVLPSPPGRSP